MFETVLIVLLILLLIVSLVVAGVVWESLQDEKKKTQEAEKVIHQLQHEYNVEMRRYESQLNLAADLYARDLLSNKLTHDSELASAHLVTEMLIHHYEKEASS